MYSSHGNGRDASPAGRLNPAASHFAPGQVQPPHLRAAASANSNSPLPPHLRGAATTNPTSVVPPHLRGAATTNSTPVVPPHLRGAATANVNSQPPHLRGATSTNPSSVVPPHLRASPTTSANSQPPHLRGATSTNTTTVVPPHLRTASTNTNEVRPLPPQLRGAPTTSAPTTDANSQPPHLKGPTSANPTAVVPPHSRTASNNEDRPLPPHLRGSAATNTNSHMNSAASTNGDRPLPPHLRGVATANAPSPPHLKNAAPINPVSVPPHLSGAAAFRASSPPHTMGFAADEVESLGNSTVNDALVTDGNVDTSTFSMEPTPNTSTFVVKSEPDTSAFAANPTFELTPPASPDTVAKLSDGDIPRQTIEDPFVASSSQGWMPRGVTVMPKLDSKALAEVPKVTETVSFHHDFLANLLGGAYWTPGLKYIPPNEGVCPLPGRSYYMIDSTYDPYLPREPGQNGAKLIPFFNVHPLEVYPDASEACFEEAPMFVCNTPWATGDKRRYIYFGHYSQTRWSDKLDYDRMVEQVPYIVKQYWAEELSAKGRDEWLTKALMDHFFPVDKYEGRLPKFPSEGSVDHEEDEKHAQGVLKDAENYVRLLAGQNKDAVLRTSWIKKELIMNAFEASDSDEPKGLRLWWEYLQCVKFDRGFYNMLVQLQNRNSQYK